MFYFKAQNSNNLLLRALLKMISTLLIIDAMNLIRRIYAVQQKQHGDTLAALIATESTSTNALKKLLRIHQPTHVICVFDNHAPSWRHQIYPVSGHFR